MSAVFLDGDHREEVEVERKHMVDATRESRPVAAAGFAGDPKRLNWSYERNSNLIAAEGSGRNGATRGKFDV